MDLERMLSAPGRSVLTIGVAARRAVERTGVRSESVAVGDVAKALMSTRRRAVLVDLAAGAEAIDVAVRCARAEGVPAYAVGPDVGVEARIDAYLIGASGVVGADRGVVFRRPGPLPGDRDDEDDDEVAEVVRTYLARRTTGVTGLRHGRVADVLRVRAATAGPAITRLAEEVVAAVGAEAAGTSPPESFTWATSLDGDGDGARSVLDRRPRRVTAGDVYTLSTTLTVDQAADGPEIPAAAVLGAEVVFRAVAVGAELAWPGGEDWRPFVESHAQAVTDLGTPSPLVCRVRVTAALDEQVHLDLSIHARPAGAADERFGQVGSHRLVLEVEAAPPPSRRRRADPPTSSVDADRLLRAAPADVDLLLAPPLAQLTVSGAVKTGPAPPSVGTDARVASAVRRLTALSEAHPPVGDGFAIDRPGEVLSELARIGAELHAAVFAATNPDGGDPMLDLQAIGDAIRVRGAHDVATSGGDVEDVDRPVLEVTARSFGIPWGLLYDGPEDPPDISGFWGARYDIRRTIGGIPDPALPDPATAIARLVVGPEVPGGADELAQAEVLAASDHDVRLDPTLLGGAALVEWARTREGADLLYLFCHAAPAMEHDHLGNPVRAKPPLESRLGFAHADDATDAVTLDDLRRASGAPPSASGVAALARRPRLVILNACRSGALDQLAGAPFVDFFTQRWGAAAFVGTDWPIHERLAHRVGGAVLTRLLDGRTSPRAAFRAVTVEAIRAGNPFVVMYGLHGDVSTTLGRGRA